MPRKPKPIPNVAYTQAWLTQLAEERKAPGTKPRAEKEKTHAYNVSSRQTFTVACVGPGTHQTNHRTEGTQKPKPRPLWGYYKQLRTLKIGIILLAEQGA